MKITLQKERDLVYHLLSSLVEQDAYFELTGARARHEFFFILLRHSQQLKLNGLRFPVCSRLDFCPQLNSRVCNFGGRQTCFAAPRLVRFHCSFGAGGALLLCVGVAAFSPALALRLTLNGGGFMPKRVRVRDKYSQGVREQCIVRN